MYVNYISIKMEGKQTKKRKLRGKKNGNTQQRIPFSFRVKPPKSSSRRVPCDLPWSASLHSPVGFPGDAVVKNPPANAGDGRDAGSIPGLGGSPVEGNGNLLQYSCLKKKNPMDRGALQATVHGVAKSQTRLSKCEDPQHSSLGCPPPTSLFWNLLLS